MPANNKNDKPIFDVAEPGKSTPSPTSRPVIIGHGPMLKDPMVSQQEDQAEAPKPEVQETKKPDSSPAGAAKPKETSKAKEAPKDKKLVPSAEASAEIKETAKKDSQAAVVEAVADQAVAKKSTKATPEEIAKQAELEKLVEDKTYFVPIGQVTKRRKRRRFASVFIVLIIAAFGVAYYAQQTGMIEF